MTKILDGRATRDAVLAQLTEKVRDLKPKPTLAIVLVGDDPASQIYVREKEKAAKIIGVNFELIKKTSSVSQRQLETLIEKLNRDQSVKGIVVQKPLPRQIDDDRVDLLISPEKDVDGLNPASELFPTTARGVIKLLKEAGVKIAGKDAVVVGRSKLSGLPTALLLLKENATVTICHSKTVGLKGKTTKADILVVAAGVPKLIGADMVKQGAVVVDVGTNRVPNTKKLVGDVDYENVKNVAAAISPVPGGVGPMIVAGLMMNLVEAASK
ncbi:MAG: tetrahydrofolate dehydrogenase/cyclohydrolase catalytic domain-containing protein [Candidatus Woykebacteria bacterium]